MYRTIFLIRNISTIVQIYHNGNRRVYTEKIRIYRPGQSIHLAEIIQQNRIGIIGFSTTRLSFHQSLYLGNRIRIYFTTFKCEGIQIIPDFGKPVLSS